MTILMLKMKERFGKGLMMTLEAKRVAKVEEAEAVRASSMMNPSKAFKWLKESQSETNSLTTTINNKQSETSWHPTKPSTNPQPFEAPWPTATLSNIKMQPKIQS